MTQLINNLIHKLRPYTDRAWYPFVLSFLAFIDHFVVVIPSDGMLVTSTLLAPRRWFAFFMLMAVGSSLGAYLLAYLIKSQGMIFLLKITGPEMLQSSLWQKMTVYMDDYGLWALFISSTAPIVQLPAIAIAAFSKASLWDIFVAFYGGRLIKYYLIAWATSHAPKLISKMWGVREEAHLLKETFPVSKEETPHSHENVN